MKKVQKLILFLFIFFQFAVLFLQYPQVINTASLTSASATLSNSRLSYRAGVATGTIATSTVDIDTSGFPDNDTNHLFPNDVLCFADAAFSGCSEQKTYTVNNIIDSDTFQLTSALSASLGANDLAIATQSGSMTISFVTTTEIPAAGNILVTIPMADNADGNDGFPDTNGSVTTNGFDLNTIAATDISTTGCTDGDWVTTETITEGSGTTDHTIEVSRQTTACAASSTVTITIDSDPGIINPAPITSGHTQGIADVYELGIKTRDGSDNTLDEIDIKVAPIEAVFVSATVDETIAFTVAGVNTSSSTCGQTTDITTTAYSVPWGTFTASDTFFEGSQQLTVSTNADAGYAVTIEENDQMGKNGGACSGASAGEAENCIEDTTCDGAACTESTSADWATATNNGLGFSLANQSGTDASFLYNESARTFSSRQIADQEVPETKQSVMTSSAPVSGSSAYVCYRISVSGTQPAGYYFNQVKYTATATF
ncbi:MAG: hypothetical protein WEC80_00355 [Patescibacteria group bacterium]